MIRRKSILPYLRATAWALSLASAATLSAQSADSASSETPDTDDEETLVTLSPFEVRADKDVGYMASSTLAGSRLNTELKDVAAPISVFTKEFLDDIGLVDVQQALEYGLNSLQDIEGTGNVFVGSNGTFKMRGISGGGRARNYFGTGLNIDFYNTERLDFSRGPNAILFGQGSPAGIINTSTKFARIGKDFRAVTARFGSYDDRRVTVDVNESLGDKLALRANLLWEEVNGYREFEFQDKTGVALAGTWRPFQNTQIKVEGEWMDRKETRSRPWPPVDQFSVWEAAGSPTSGSATAWGNAVPNTSGLTNLMYFANGPLAGQAIWNTSARGFRLSNGPGVISGLNTTAQVLDFSLVPRNSNFAGPGARVDSDSTVGGIYLEQRLGEDLVVELASFAQYEEFTTVGYVNFGQIGVRYDANAYIPQFDASGNLTGTVANPNVGKMILTALGASGNNSHAFSKSYGLTHRATANYELDFGKIFQNENLTSWLGRHSLAALYEMGESDGDRRAQRRVNTSPLRPGGPNSNYFTAANHVPVASYLDPWSSNVKERGYVDPGMLDIPDQTIRGNSAFALKQELKNQSWTGNESERDSWMFATQSRFWNERIVALFGWRHDESKGWSSTQVTQPGTGEVTGFIMNSVPNNVSDLNPRGITEGDTFTRGVVFHALPNLVSLYYNQASNFQGNAVAEVFGVNNNLALIGNREGEGKDAGVKLFLFDGKLNATIGWYETGDVNQAISVNGLYAVYMDGIEDAIHTATNAPGTPIDVGGTAALPQRDSRDFTSTGIEVEITANPTRNLRITANLYKADTENSNLMPWVQRYIEDNRARWESRPNDPIDQVTYGQGIAATVGQVVDQIDAQLVTDLASEGQRPVRDREYTVNLFGTYTFEDSSVLRGFAIGLGAQHRGPSLLAYRVYTDGGPAFTPAYTQYNAMLSYRRKLSDKVNLRVQLNVDNLLDELDPQAVAGGEPPNLATNTLPLIDGVAYNIMLPEPRRFSLTTTLEF